MSDHAHTSTNNYRHIVVSDKELREGTTAPHTIQASLEEFHKNGFVILENAISVHTIDHISRRMIEDIPKAQSMSDIHYTFSIRTRNMLQMPPLSTEFLSQDLYANRHAIAILDHIIGPKPQLSLVMSNVALPGGVAQPVHSELYAEIFSFTQGVEIYLYLDDTSPANGSTQLWPGTHKVYSKKHHSHKDYGWIKTESLIERRKIVPQYKRRSRKARSVCET